MKSFSSYFIILFSIYFTFISCECNDPACAKGIMKNPGDFTKCKMCACDELCSLKRDDEIYDCYIKVFLSFLLFFYLN